MEAIGIQTSLINIIFKLRKRVSIDLFDYAITKLVMPYKGIKYIYAYAWDAMSNILMKKYNFSQIIYYSQDEEEDEIKDYFEVTKYNDVEEKYIKTKIYDSLYDVSDPNYTGGLQSA